MCVYREKLLGRLLDTVNRLVEFEDTQAATYLLRVSFSIVRAVHFMRTTPLDQWREQASNFDGMIRAAIETIIGFPMDDPTFAQASLTPRLGGLGPRKVVEHADLAYHASWHEAQKVAKEKWTSPANLPAEYLSQQDASFEFDEKMHTYLVDQADTLVDSSLQFQVMKMAKILCCAPESFEPPSLTASEFLSWIKKSPVLCASSLFIYLATMPLAAQRKEMLLFDTIRFVT